MNLYSAPITWRRILWPRPFTEECALDLLGRLATDHATGPLIWEARGSTRGISTFLGDVAERSTLVTQVLTSHVPEARITKDVERLAVTHAAKVSLRRPSLSLSSERISACTRAVLAALSSVGRAGEEVVLQVTLGPRTSPYLLSEHPSEPKDDMLDFLLGTPRPATSATKSSMRARASSHGFKAIVRIGAKADTPTRAKAIIMEVFAAMRVAEAAGALLKMSPEDPAALNGARRPHFWPLALSAPEVLLLLGWPVGEGELPGLPAEHPRLLDPPRGMEDSTHAFAVSNAPGTHVRLGISARDSLEHTVLLGPTGSGKSNAMLSMVCASIRDGQGVLVIDPKADLVDDILARIPPGREDDVVVIDPTDTSPVGLNPFADARNPTLIADGVLAVFKELFFDSWGPRTQDILTAALLTLARAPGSSLLWLPTLLTDAAFRGRLTENVTDKIGLAPFWASYEAMSAGQRAQAIAPVMNKLRQFLLRPALRGMLGQGHPRFQMADLFEKRRIVLVSLNKGLIGSETARLLGSLVVSELWPLILARAALPQIRRPVTSIFIDEVQDYLALPTDLSDALSQARSLGVAFTLAHQYRNQLPKDVRAGVDTNARNKVIFGLNAYDAHDMAAMAPELEATDFILLPRYSIYAHLPDAHGNFSWISGRTLKAPAPVSDPISLRTRSSALYGCPAQEVEQEALEAIGYQADENAKSHKVTADTLIGRKRRQP